MCCGLDTFGTLCDRIIFNVRGVECSFRIKTKNEFTKISYNEMCDTNITCVSLRLEAVPFLSMRTIWINHELMECLKCMCEWYIFQFQVFAKENDYVFPKRKKKCKSNANHPMRNGWFEPFPLIDFLTSDSCFYFGFITQNVGRCQQEEHAAQNFDETRRE